MSAIAITSSGSGAGTLSIAAPITATNRTLTLPDGTGTFAVNGVSTNIVSGTAVASTSGTSIDFTGIPSWVKRITVMFSAVSTSSTSLPQIQLGDSGGVETTGYNCAASSLAAAAMSTVNATSGFVLNRADAASSISGQAVITLLDVATNTWAFSSVFGLSNSTFLLVTGGSKPLSATLDRVRITTVNGTDTFDAGSINILYE
jgi:hypothetical protein